MTRIDGESKRKLREMGVTSLVDALETQDDTLTLGMPFEERIKLLVDDAHATFTHAKVEGLIRRAGLRYPNADLRKLDLVEQRGIDRGIIAQLGTCTFIERHQNVVFQGFTGSGKSYLGSALAKRACQHRYRAHYIRMPDLEEAWAAGRDKPGGKEKFLRKYAAFTLLVIDEWLLDNMPRRTGISAWAPAFTPTPSWTASCTTQSGSRPAAPTCANTPQTTRRDPRR
jgi:DNA replication protein DnaC